MAWSRVSRDLEARAARRNAAAREAAAGAGSASPHAPYLPPYITPDQPKETMPGLVSDSEDRLIWERSGFHINQGGDIQSVLRSHKGELIGIISSPVTKDIRPIMTTVINELAEKFDLDQSDLYSQLTRVHGGENVSRVLNWASESDGPTMLSGAFLVLNAMNRNRGKLQTRTMKADTVRRAAENSEKHKLAMIESQKRMAEHSAAKAIEARKNAEYTKLREAEREAERKAERNAYLIKAKGGVPAREQEMAGLFKPKTEADSLLNFFAPPKGGARKSRKHRQNRRKSQNSRKNQKSRRNRK